MHRKHRVRELTLDAVAKERVQTTYGGTGATAVARSRSIQTATAATGGGHTPVAARFIERGGGVGGS